MSKKKISYVKSAATLGVTVRILRKFRADPTWPGLKDMKKAAVWVAANKGTRGPQPGQKPARPLKSKRKRAKKPARPLKSKRNRAKKKKRGKAPEPEALADDPEMVALHRAAQLRTDKLEAEVQKLKRQNIEHDAAVIDDAWLEIQAKIRHAIEPLRAVIDGLKLKPAEMRKLNKGLDQVLEAVS